MNELHLKCRSRLDFCYELMEVAEDCGIPEKCAIVAEHGFILSLILSGMSSEATLKWKSKLKQDK